MDNWKQSLDKYLTSEPSYFGDYNNWCEQVVEKFSDGFYDDNEDWILDSNQINDWLNKLSYKSPEDAAYIIERAHSLFIKNKI